VVRVTNPTRPIIIGPAGWNALDQLETLQLPADPNLIITFHYYSPFEFTHQGAEWVEGSDAWLGTSWTGTPAQVSGIERDFDRAAAWAAQNGRPVFLGEFGAYERAEPAWRALWTAAVARAAEARGFTWSYWEFCAGFGVYDPEADLWRYELLQSLIPTP
jgi:endoglucanase